MSPRTASHVVEISLACIFVGALALAEWDRILDWLRERNNPRPGYIANRWKR